MTNWKLICCNWKRTWHNRIQNVTAENWNATAENQKYSTENSNDRPESGIFNSQNGNTTENILRSYKRDQKLKWPTSNGHGTTENKMPQLKTEMTNLKTKFSQLITEMQLCTAENWDDQLKVDVAQLKTTMSQLKTEMINLKPKFSQLNIEMQQLKIEIAQPKTEPKLKWPTDMAQLKTEMTSKLKCNSWKSKLHSWKLNWNWNDQLKTDLAQLKTESQLQAESTQIQPNIVIAQLKYTMMQLNTEMPQLKMAYCTFENWKHTTEITIWNETTKYETVQLKTGKLKQHLNTQNWKLNDRIRDGRKFIYPKSNA